MVLASVFEVPRPGGPSWEDLATQFHEIVHHWLDYGENFGGDGYPRWLEEGTADVLATVAVREIGGHVGDRPLPTASAWMNATQALLTWGHASATPRQLARASHAEMMATSSRYALAYHVVKEVWEKDEGKTLVRLLKAFAGKEEVPPPEEQERIFEEIVGEPLEAVIARLAARAPVGEDQAGR